MNSNEQLSKMLMASRQPSYAGEPQYSDTTNYDQIFADQNARNRQADALNRQLNEQQANPELALLDRFQAIDDRYKARKNAEITSPLYKEEQTKSNAQGLAQALLGTKQVESMSYGGNPVKQSPDGKYWLENGQEVTDVANIQSNNKFDPIAGSLEALHTGNPLALQALQEQMKPHTTTTPADKLQEIMLKAQLAKEIADSKPKKDTDSKMTELSKAKDILGSELTPWTENNANATERARNIIGQALLDPAYKNSDVVSAAQNAKDKGSNWFKNDFDSEHFTKALAMLKNK